MKVKETSPAYFTQHKVFTCQDYLRLPEDSYQYQVIDGELVMTPASYTISPASKYQYRGQVNSILKEQPDRSHTLCSGRRRDKRN